jgi:hypothetical protein
MKAGSWSTITVTPLIALFLVVLAHPRELYPGQYSQVDPDKRKWYRNQTSPSGYNCCSEADGTDVDEDIRDGEYWVRWDKSVAIHPETSGWMKVPAAVIIPGPNRYGPIVWWAYSEDAGLSIRCYSRGPQL